MKALSAHLTLQFLAFDVWRLINHERILISNIQIFFSSELDGKNHNT